MGNAQVTERSRAVLAAIVRQHILTGEAVASADIAGRVRRRVSSATVRNVMARLELEGYLQQPHTSAGRVPTAKAFEFYARQAATAARLSSPERVWISRRLERRAAPPEPIWAHASHVLAEFSHGVALVAAPPLAGTVMDEIRFLPLADQRVLVVIVARGGQVRDQVVVTGARYRSDELERMAAYLNQNFRGWSLRAVREELERRVAVERSRYRKFLETALALCQEGLEPASASAKLYVEGTPHLLEGAGQASAEELRALLEAVEQKERLAQLLEDTLAGAPPGLHIRIGLEQLSPVMSRFALISAACGEEQGRLGTVALLGPTRMDYARAISAVCFIAEWLGQSQGAAGVSPG